MTYKQESIKPYDENGKKGEQVEQMFDRIAHSYDLLNHALSFGIDKHWRKAAIHSLKPHAPRTMLDVATGTGDFAVKLYDTIHPATLTGIDLSEGMLDVARRKVEALHLEQHITFEQGDSLHMRYADGTFDAVTVAFGVRNFEHIDQGYKEMYRVMRPGGLLCVVELSPPRNALVRFFYNLYAMHVIPFFGSLKSGDKSAYRYLPESIAAVPQGQAMLELMRQAGFGHCSVRRLTLGTCSIYTAVK